MSVSKGKVYSAVDITKFIFSICIVILHTEVFRLLPYSLPYYFEKCILRLAVPFFFCSSGFLLEKKLYSSNIQEYKVIVKKYILRLLIPLFFFESVNIILEVIKMFLQDFTPDKILREVIRHILFYPYGALWYVQASIIGIVIIYPFIINQKIYLAILAGGFCYLFALLANNYYFLVEDCLPFFKLFIDKYLEFFISARNGLFVGVLMISLGIMSYDLYVKVKINGNKLTFVCVLVYLLYFYEILNLKNLSYVDDGALYLTHIVLIPILLLKLVNCRIESERTIILRNLSTGVYFLHRIILSILFILSLQLEWFSYTQLYNFIIVLGGSMAICIMSYKSNCKLCILLK